MKHRTTLGSPKPPSKSPSCFRSVSSRAPISSIPPSWSVICLSTKTRCHDSLQPFEEAMIYQYSKEGIIHRFVRAIIHHRFVKTIIHHHSKKPTHRLEKTITLLFKRTIDCNHLRKTLLTFPREDGNSVSYATNSRRIGPSTSRALTIMTTRMPTSRRRRFFSPF